MEEGGGGGGGGEGRGGVEGFILDITVSSGACPGDRGRADSKRRDVLALADREAIEVWTSWRW